MREGLVLSLVSSLQMAQQSALNALSEGLSPAGLAASAAAFPLGKLSTTLLMAARPVDSRQALDIDAFMLIFGGIVALVPSWVFLAIGRFFMGAGAGIGFVGASVLLAQLIPYTERPAHFFVLGIAFAVSTFVANILPLLVLSSYTVVLTTCAFSIITGGLYLLLKPGPAKEELEEERAPLSPFQNRRSDCPVTLTNVLMVLNVSIGVPVILGYSTLIFERFGLTHSSCCYLSIGFPICQIVLILILNRQKYLNRKTLIVGGYCISVFVQFLLLITSSYPFLPEEQKPHFLSFWFFVLAVITSIPCNTAICVIAEQFSTPSEQLRYASTGRALMWLFSAISTSTFIPLLDAYGFTIAFLPYALLSLLLLVWLYILYPKDSDE